ncbi:MAG TPA: TIGR03943 family protein [Mycobacteriales bacterium]|nr:TIGR03943 family protein [Mycobacteriales bacterium]
MSRETQNAITILVGVAALRLGLTDAHLRYVKASLGPWLVVAGVLLVALGVLGLFDRRPVDAAAADAPDDGHDPEHGHDPFDGHEHHGPSVAWLLTLPVLAIFLIAPAPLGSFAANRNTTRLEAPKAQFPDLPGEERGAVPLTLREFNLRTFFDDEKSLEGKKIRLVGFATPHGENETFLTRFILSCCAADGRPIKVALKNLSGPRPPADQWLEVEGTWIEPDTDQQGEALIGRAAELVVTSIRPVSAPSQTYE